MSARKGFTLIELLIAMIIMGILASMAVFSYQNMLHEGMARAAYYNFQVIIKAERAYYLSHGTYYIDSGNPLTSLNEINTNLKLNIKDTNFSYTADTFPTIPPGVLLEAGTNFSDGILTLILNPKSPPSHPSCSGLYLRALIPDLCP